MTVKFKNFDYFYTKPSGKKFFVPSAECRKIGQSIIERVLRAHRFPGNYFHLCTGGHVSLLHRARCNGVFFWLDLEAFFPSVTRNRVARNLRKLGSFSDAEYLAKWSCVRLDGVIDAFCLPYGFVQSPILSSLVLDQSSLGKFIRKTHDQDVFIGVFVDDIVVSARDIEAATRVRDALLEKVKQSSFAVNTSKISGPCQDVEVFNCKLSRGNSLVTEERRSKFYQRANVSLSSEAAFERYCDRVKALQH